MYIDPRDLAYYLAEIIYVTRDLERKVEIVSQNSDAIEAIVSDLAASEGRLATKLQALQNAVDASANETDPAVQSAIDDLRSEASKISGLVPTDTVTNGNGVASPAAPTGADGSTDTEGNAGVTEPAGNVSTATPPTDPSRPIDTGSTSTNTVTPVTDTQTGATDDSAPTVTSTDTTAPPAETPAS